MLVLPLQQKMQGTVYTGAAFVLGGVLLHVTGKGG